MPQASNAKGLDKVSQLLKIDAMDTKTKHEYDAYMKDVSISKSMLATAKIEGREEGREGIREGMEKGTKEIKVSLPSEKNKKLILSPLLFRQIYLQSKIQGFYKKK